MNWRRGLFRAWVVFAGVWWLYIAITAYHIVTPQWRTDGPFAGLPFRPGYVREQFIALGVVGVAVPAALFLVGLGVVWVISGFRRDTPARTEEGDPRT